MGAVGYLITQFLKLIMLATFIPEGATEIGFLNEFLKALIGGCEIMGFYWLIQSQKSSKDTKILSISIGWATMGNIATKLVPLWIGARELDFSWRHTLLSISGNISIINAISLAYIVALWSRKNDLNTSYFYFLIALLITSIIPFFTNILFIYFLPNQFIIYLLEAVCALSIGIYTWKTFN